MKNIKIDKKYVIIMFLVLIVGVGTITFAYFQGSVLNDLINPTNVSTGSIDIKISDTSVNATAVEPLFTNGNNFEKASFVKHFSVTNGTNTLNTCVELYLKVNSIDSALANSYFKYAIVNDDTDTTITGDFNGVSSGTELDLGSLYFFEESTSKKYTMYIWIEYNPDVDQMSMLGKSMNATLFVKAQDSKTKDTCDTRSTFKLTYELNGGTGCDNTNVNKGDDVTLCTPTNTDTTLSFGGWYADNKYTSQVTSITNMSDDVKLYAMWTCTFDGELTQGAEYVNGQYTYRYKQEGIYSSTLSWRNIAGEGWGVQLTDKSSTDPVTSKVCTYINDKPVISMSYMFNNSQATTLDLSSFNTSNVTDMSSMFYNSQATTLDLSNFTITSSTKITSMFSGAAATTGYAKDEATATLFNDSSVTNIPSTLVFRVK